MPAQLLSGLPADAQVRSAAIDSSGNVVLAGTIGRVVAGVYSSDGFIARYAPDGVSQLSWLLLPDSSVAALATDSTGNVYAAGNAASARFPTTEGAWQRTVGEQGSGFLLKLDR